MRPGFRLIGGRFLRFGLVGLLGVAVNSAVLFVAHGVVGLPLAFASVLAVEVAILHNYLWNDRWTFGYREFSLARFGKFNLTSLGGLLITTGVLYALVTYGRVYYLLANLVGVGLATGWNFMASMLWTWGVEP